MGLSLYEQETIVNMNNDEKEMDIYTASPALMRRLSSLPAYKKTGERKQEGKVVAMTFRADKKLLTLRGERVKGRQLTDEEKAAARERLQKAKAEKKAVKIAYNFFSSAD